MDKADTPAPHPAAHDDAAPVARDGKFSFESVQDAKTLTPYLKALVEGFEAGSMRFSRKDLDMVLSPQGLIGFAVEAKAKDGRMKLTIKFNWREAVEDAVDTHDPMSITPGGGGA